VSVSEYFADDYAGAREAFIRAADRAGARRASYPHPSARGPAGEALSIDVAMLGPESAEHVLLVLSGTHGAEGFCGSGCQVGLLEDRLHESLPQRVGLVLVHALNPHGFAWLRRVNEDGVDLNRNFVDFSKPLPDSSGYERLHEWLVPRDWQGEGRRAAEAAIADYVRAHGERAFQAAVSGGQYTRPTGLFYGGTSRTWSARTLARLLRECLSPALARLAVLDLHTGLGPTGYGEPIAMGSDAGCARARRWYGADVKSLAGGESISAAVVGTVPNGVVEARPDVETTYVALEFGTRPIGAVLDALRGDHWLATRPDANDAARASIKHALRDAFYVDTPAWRAAVYGRTADFAYRALLQLA
jgi:hypothetical protein